MLPIFQQYIDSKAEASAYGSWRWLSLKELWDTGYKQKGGLILFSRPVIEQEGTGKSLDRL